MSLHFLGIRDFPSLHRELTSSQLPTIIPEDSTEDLAQDSKDVLVQRLLDLANHIQEQELPDQALSTLHHDVDHMERTWQKTPAPKPPLVRPILRSFGSSMSLRSNGSHQDEPFWRPGSPLSPGLESPFRFHSPKTISKAPEPAKAAPSAMRCAILANEADALLAKLVKVVTELKSRREESEVRTSRNPSRSGCIFCISAISTPTDVSQHIHDLLITRAEKAAQRVTELEDKIADLYVHFNALYTNFFGTFEKIFPEDVREMPG